MPGHIESVPFLSQLEDVDKYLSEYRSLKIMTQTARNFAPVNAHQLHQMRSYNGNENGNGLENESIEYVKGSNGMIQMGNYGNMISKNNNGNSNNNTSNNNNNNTSNGSNSNKNINGNNGGVSMNRKRFSYINNGQLYRFNNPANAKYGSQKQQTQQSTGFGHTPIISNHFKQTYPQLYYNSSNNGSNVSLDQLNSPFYGSTQTVSQQQQIPSGSSSPSLTLQKLDTSLSGNSSISSYNGGFDQVVPVSSEFSAQFPSAPSPFSNYLGNGLVNTSPAAVKTVSIDAPPAIPATGGDFLTNFPSGSLVNDRGTTQSLGFEQKLSNQAVISDASVSNSIATVSQDNSLNNIEPAATEDSGNASSSQLFMNDFSIGWGSNHVNASSSNSSTFGIWNNDMSVWS